MRNETVIRNIRNIPLKVATPNNKLDPEGLASSLHYHDELEFLAVMDGKFECTVYGKKYLAEAGDIVFVNSGVPHSTYKLTPCNTGLVQFRESDWTDEDITKIIKYSMRFQSQLSYPIVIFRDKNLFSAFEELFSEVKNKGNSYEKKRWS